MSGARLTPEILLHAYTVGVFPMSEGRDTDEVFWVDPRKRGVFPLDKFHISRSLARTLRQSSFTVKINSDFEAVMRACADRSETWINEPIITLYKSLFDAGHAHSLEIWEDATLLGGVYGLAIGGAFFGESMFSRRPNASKMALAYLMDRLQVGGFTLFDTQFITPHLASLGAIEIPRARYRASLKTALEKPANFHTQATIPTAQDVLQRNTQTS